MARLSASERAKLPDSAFAIVDGKGRRKLPIHDEAHVRNALSRFERVAFEDDAARERARKRLLTAAKRFGIVPVGFITGQLRSERRAGTPDISALPTGTVTFLMTDIEGSTTLLRRMDDRYAELLKEVRAIMRNATRRLGGVVVDVRADDFFAVFKKANSALEAALAIQRALRDRSWPDDLEVRVRAGLHTGRPELTETGYVGLAVNTAARVCSAGHGGQILVSERTKVSVEGSLPAGVRLRSLGRHRLAGLPREEVLYQAEAKDLIRSFPPLRTAPNGK